LLEIAFFHFRDPKTASQKNRTKISVVTLAYVNKYGCYAYLTST
jgi:hypothetical protein